MATARTTIRAAFADILSKAKVALVGSSGTGSSENIQAVVEGEKGTGMAQVPYVLFQLLSAKVKSKADNDTAWECSVRIRIVTQTTQADGATAECLAKLGLVENFLEAYVRPAGVLGLFDAEWSFSYPTDPQSGRTMQLDSIRTFTVAVAKDSN